MLLLRILSTFCLPLLALDSLALSSTEQRALFIDTEKAIERGAIRVAETNIQRLGDYSLVPFLQVNLLRENIERASDQEILDFLAAHEGTWLAEKLRLRWLPELFNSKRYSDYIVQYRKSKPSTLSSCRFGEALLRTNQSQRAFAMAPDLWLHGKSRPDACDYLFEQWQKSEQFSEEYLWQRFILARKAGQHRFSGYLRKQAKTTAIRDRISTYFRLQKRPELVLDASQFHPDKPGYADLIDYGIRRLAAKNPQKAETAYRQLAQQTALSDQQKTRLRERIQKAYVDIDQPDDALRLARSAATPTTESHADWHLRRELKNMNWQAVIDWINLLDSEDAADTKWRYWLARARNQTGLSSIDIYAEIARKRSYYGFLSAMITEQPYSLNHSPAVIDTDLYDALRQRPGVIRARELNAVEYYVNARKSWNHAISDLQQDQFTTAAGVALESQIFFEAIRAMAAAKSWDDLDIRFPLIHLQDYDQSAQDQSTEISWIYAISRQESSFAPDIKSRSNAVGIMQILPSTAREMARDIGVKYERKRLTEPAYNIPLGTAYLNKGKTELDDNMVYATAGYNAGINGIRRWLDSGTDSLPLDVWIETLPYRETRDYVKKVLAYSVIFADKLGTESPLEKHSDQFFIRSQAASPSLAR